MTPAQAIAPQIIGTASGKLTQAAEFGSRIAWWLRHGYSSERWVQFEWAFRLQAEVGVNFVVLCEHRRVDITLVRTSAAGTPPWAFSPEAGIELKWWGNWYVNDRSLAGFKADIEKVNAYPFPAAAVLLFLMVDPVADAGHYQWIRQQIESGIGVRDVAALRDGYFKPLGLQPDKETVAAVPRQPDLGQPTLHTFIFYNGKARLAKNILTDASF